MPETGEAPVVVGSVIDRHMESTARALGVDFLEGGVGGLSLLARSLSSAALAGGIRQG